MRRCTRSEPRPRPSSSTPSLLFGSGFLAVLVAGILIGDVRAPFKPEVELFTSGRSGLGEIVAFGAGSVHLDPGRHPSRGVLDRTGHRRHPDRVDQTDPGRRRHRRHQLHFGEQAFILWAGLKGAVPSLLGTYILGAGGTEARRIYEIIFVVVLISVVVQGGLVPTFARLFRVPMTTSRPEPFTVGLRFTDEPDDLYRCVVAAGAPAEGSSVADLNIRDDAWINMIRRYGQLVQISGTTVLQEGDELLVQTDRDVDLKSLFRAPHPAPTEVRTPAPPAICRPGSPGR